jgi:hypothetical protein
MHLGHARRWDTTEVHPGEAQAPAVDMVNADGVLLVVVVAPQVSVLSQLAASLRRATILEHSTCSTSTSRVYCRAILILRYCIEPHSK